MMYFLAFHQATHLAMSGKRFAISSSHFFCSLYCVTVVTVNILFQIFLNSSLVSVRPYLHHLLMHLAANYLDSHEINTENICYCTVIGTNLIHYYWFWAEFVFSLCNMAPNFILQFLEKADFLGRFTLYFNFNCNSNDVSHGWVVYKKGKCFVTNASWMRGIKIHFLTL